MSTSPTPIRIGALAPLTPPGWVHAGRHLIAGLQRAITDVNTTGGIGGRPLDLLIRDTAADPAKAEAAVDELAHLGIAALAGEYHSVVARTAAARADTLGLPYLCTSAVLDTLTQHPTDRVARLSPPQSRGWRTYADHLLATGHTRIAVATQPSVYWAAGTRILTDHLTPHGATVLELDAATLTPAALCDELAGNGADTLLLLTGFPEPAVPIVTAVRRDPRLTGLQLGAPAGQPEFTAWTELLGADGTGVPFLRYLPDQLTPSAPAWRPPCANNSARTRPSSPSRATTPASSWPNYSAPAAPTGGASPPTAPAAASSSPAPPASPSGNGPSPHPGRRPRPRRPKPLPGPAHRLNTRASRPITPAPGSPPPPA